MEITETLSNSSKTLRQLLVHNQMFVDSFSSRISSLHDRLQHIDALISPTRDRINLARKAHQRIEETLTSVEDIVARFNVQKQLEAKINEPHISDIDEYLDTLNKIRKNVEFIRLTNNSVEDSLTNTQKLLEKAMERVKLEFKDLLLKLETPSIPQKTMIAQLKKLAKWMISVGQNEECYNIYRDIRAKELIEKMKKNGIERLNPADVENLDWPYLEECMMHWVRLLAILVTEFASEKELCNQVFHEPQSYQNKCFKEITGPTAIRLLNFVENIAKIKAEPEKLFAFLEMYGILDELYPQIKVIFNEKSLVSMYEAFYSILGKLSKTIDEIVHGVIESIEKDDESTNFTIQDGAVHPLSQYVIKYINRMLRYRTTLNHAFGEENTVEPRNSHLADVIESMLSALQLNLERKSKQSQSTALSHVFLMNNVHYMVKRIQRSKAIGILGDDWVQKHRRVVQQHAQNYKRNSWAKVLEALKIQTVVSAHGIIVSSFSKSALKQRFNSFNSEFEALYQQQSKWLVRDRELRESLQLAVVEVVLPAYCSFLKHAEASIERWSSCDKYLRYPPSHLENLIVDLFQGKPKELLVSSVKHLKPGHERNYSSEFDASLRIKKSQSQLVKWS